MLLLRIQEEAADHIHEPESVIKESRDDENRRMAGAEHEQERENDRRHAHAVLVALVNRLVGIALDGTLFGVGALGRDERPPAVLQLLPERAAVGRDDPRDRVLEEARIRQERLDEAERAPRETVVHVHVMDRVENDRERGRVRDRQERGRVLESVRGIDAGEEDDADVHDLRADGRVLEAPEERHVRLVAEFERRGNALVLVEVQALGCDLEQHFDVVGHVLHVRAHGNDLRRGFGGADESPRHLDDTQEHRELLERFGQIFAGLRERCLGVTLVEFDDFRIFTELAARAEHRKPAHLRAGPNALVPAQRVEARGDVFGDGVHRRRERRVIHLRGEHVPADNHAVDDLGAVFLDRVGTEDHVALRDRHRGGDTRSLPAHRVVDDTFGVGLAGDTKQVPVYEVLVLGTRDELAAHAGRFAERRRAELIDDDVHLVLLFDQIVVVLLVKHERLLEFLEDRARRVRRAEERDALGFGQKRDVQRACALERIEQDLAAGQRNRGFQRRTGGTRARSRVVERIFVTDRVVGVEHRIRLERAADLGVQLVALGREAFVIRAHVLEERVGELELGQFAVPFADEHEALVRVAGVLRAHAAPVRDALAELRAQLVGFGLAARRFDVEIQVVDEAVHGRRIGRIYRSRRRRGVRFRSVDGERTQERRAGFIEPVVLALVLHEILPFLGVHRVRQVVKLARINGGGRQAFRECLPRRRERFGETAGVHGQHRALGPCDR